jgi:hypothetical protein
MAGLPLLGQRLSLKIRDGLNLCVDRAGILSGALKGRPYKNNSELRRRLCGEFLDGGVVVLFAADFAVVFR